MAVNGFITTNPDNGRLRNSISNCHPKSTVTANVRTKMAIPVLNRDIVDFAIVSVGSSISLLRALMFN
jgi:hypothetical protein